jgi:predicted small secreted protein
MLAMTISAVILFLVSTLLTGCNIYSHYGYGRIAASQLDAASVTPLELPANVPSSNPRFRPGLAWSS